MLHEEIKGKIKESMLLGNTDALKTYRNIVSAFTNELVRLGRKPDEFLSDEEAEKVIKKLSKQVKESIKQFKAGGRMELVAEEEKELLILGEHLPEMMKKEDIQKVVLEVKEKLNINDPSKKGVLIGSVVKELKDRADGSVIREIVDSLF